MNKKNHRKKTQGKNEKHEAPKKNQKKESKKIEKKEKKEKKEKRTQSKETSTLINQKLKGALLILIGLLLLTAAGILLYNRIFKAPAIANYLPAEKTFAVIEVNLSNSESGELVEALNKYPVYKRENFTAVINEFLKADFEKDIAPWLGRKIGFALMQSNTAKNDEAIISPIAFVEVQNFRQALDFFESQKLENEEDALELIDYEGEAMYEYRLGQNIYFAFLDNYLVGSTNAVAIKSLISEAKSSNPKLSDTEKYNRISDNLPNNNIAFGFFDLSNLTKYIFKSPNFISQNGFILTSFEPFLTIFDAEGLTINKEDEGIKVRTYTSFNRDLLEGKEFLTFQEKYNASLAKYVSQDALLVWGGMDLEKQLKRIADVLGKGSEASLIIFDGILEAQKDIYFGKEVSLKDDIYPLIKNEFIIAIHDGEVPMIQVVLKLEDEGTDIEKVKKIVEGFVKENAIFKPEIREVELEDGTKGQEIVGVPEDLTQSESEYEGEKIYSISLGSKPWGIYYIIKDKKLILATAKEIIEKVIKGDQGNLNDSELFRKNIKPVLAHADELSYMNLKKLIPHIWPTVEEGGDSIIQLYLDPFYSVSSGKNYFSDGISTIHYIYLK